MRAHDKAGDTGAGDRHRVPARRTGTAPPEQRGGLLGIQAGAGNSAVVQLLRQAGHAWAQDRHEHGAGCGHQEQEQDHAREAERSVEPTVQRSAVHSVLSTAGRPLEDALRTDMEARLGADFSDVRVHSDAAAKASATEVGARAYTSGNHVVLGDGGSDRHTLAHELTHVIQQRTGPVAGTDNGDGLKVSDPTDRFEREAEANATRALAAGPGPASYEQTTAPAAPEPSAAEHAVQRAARPAARPAVQRVYDGTDPRNPQNLMYPEHWERGAGLRNADGSSTKAQAQERADLLTGKAGQAKGKGGKAKGGKPKGKKRSMDDILKIVGPALLQQLAQEGAKKSGRLELFRAMSEEEADSVLEYWGKDAKRVAVEDYVSTGTGSSGEFKANHEVMNVGSHLGDREQADTYHAEQGLAHSVLLKFTLKAGAHEFLFSPDHMALGSGYAGTVIGKATGGDYQQAADGEGKLPGYIGVKSEKRGPFSLSVAQDPKVKDASPSQLLFQMFVENVSEVSRKPV